MTAPTVTPVLRLVPNGLQNGRLHMTLIATPVRTRDDSEIRIPLDEWPQLVFQKIFGDGKVKQRAINIRQGAVQTQGFVKPLSSKSNSEWLSGRVADAWTGILPPSSVDPSSGLTIDFWEELLKSIEQSLQSNSFDCGLPSGPENAAKSGDPGTHLDRDGNYKPPEGDPSATLTIKAVLPVKHGDLALLLEFERAKRVDDLLNGKPPGSPKACHGPNSNISTEPLVDAWAAADMKETALSEDALRKALRAAKLCELKKAIAATDIERGKSAQSDVCGKVEKPVLTGDADRLNKAAASHVAGSWTQGVPDDDGEKLEAAILNDRIAQITQAYQAVVSSPAWARVFGFAFDVYLDWSGSIPPTSISPGDWQLPTDKPGDKRSVWTFVDPEGWPASKDEVTSLKSGLFRMGSDCGASGLPRFDVVTLDVRQAAEAVARPLTESGSARGFQTAGMTLIDRYRADDVRRQIARTSTEKNNLEASLYADDLVIGRRLDVGIQTKAKIEWRALGARVVQYGFRKTQDDGSTTFAAIDEKIIRDLLGPSSGNGELNKTRSARTLEQAIVNSAARLAPSHSIDSSSINDREVFVEEAFATWDGAPMGVHSGPESAQDAVNQAAGPQFPFLQRQSLPAAGYAKSSLVPPLRYGQSYRFGMRAVFLGGRSKSVDEAAALYHSDSQEFTYPRDPQADNKEWPLRRFVRQEAIGAPVVLLPGSVLDDRPEEMDFQTANAAVLRSIPADYHEADTLPKTVRGRRYLRARERVTKQELIRVFLPPTVALDEMLRAGSFDDAARRARVIKGGLRDMAYGVPAPLYPLPEGETRAGGFPIAVIEEKRAFGVEPTRKSVQPGWVKPPNERGAPAVRGASLFITANALADRLSALPLAKTSKFIPRPYYPDPHATRLLLRLRRRSDGAYVGPTCEVPVYDIQSRYPDAMPTVVIIRKATGKAGLSPQATWTKPKPAYSDGFRFDAPRGQRVQRVELALGFGADFDLEALYLPDPKVLARQFALIETLGAYRNAVPPAQINPGVALGSTETPVSNYVTTGFYPVPQDSVLEELAAKLTSHLSRTTETAEKANAITSTSKPQELQNVGAAIEELAAVTTVRVAHVVNRPLLAPAFLQGDIDKLATPEFRIMRALPTGAKDPSPCIKIDELAKRLESFEAVVGIKDYVLKGRVSFDRTTTSAIEIIATCASPRDPLFDDPTRRRSLKARVAGTWPRKTQKVGLGDPQRIPADVVDVYGFDEIDAMTGAVTLKRSEVILLRIDNLAGPGAGAMMIEAAKQEGPQITSKELLAERGEIEVGLAHLAARDGVIVERPDSNGVLFSASQLHTFPDGKARRLTLRLRAISRFAVDFETAPRWSGTSDGSVPVVRLREPLDVSEQSNESAAAIDAGERRDALRVEGGATVDVWLPASRRPDKCAPLAPVPVFQFSRRLPGDLETTRNSGVRIYLERGWYSSGEGEMLGIVLPSSADIGGAALPFVSDDEYGPIGPYVSRWGGDPIRLDYAPLTSPLTPENFGWSKSASAAMNPGRLTGILVPVQIPAPPGAEEPLTVLTKADLLTYAPRFDVDREQWFVDLNLKAPETPNLFARLGLVRYQEQAMSKELQVSEPVTVWTQLLPERTLSASVTENDGVVDIYTCVSGVAHKDVRIPKAPDGVDTTPLSKLRQPTVRFRLVHESAESGVLRRINLGNEPVPPLRIADSQTKWEHNFKFVMKDIHALGAGAVYVYAEEIESFMPATYAVEPVYIQDIFDADTLIDSGPRFAARLELPGVAAQ
ncbi:hypothetical protein FHX14_000032 [Rhizobium sp. BK619]|uniref:hypothetical protein n=1 Tax=Rhizobium sp. BK619 TaxID=2586989 RepID=UPI00161B062D|nr:hypothetical protein [Rhizobium sp. BK619]MBB3643873.1 hypothetical protein [Rhizobium sp. BK619]